MLLFLEIKREHFTIKEFILLCPSPKLVTGCYCISSFLLEQGQVSLIKLCLSQEKQFSLDCAPCLCPAVALLLGKGRAVSFPQANEKVLFSH